MEERERQELVDDLVEALARRGAPEGTRLLDLMRAEQGLVDALTVVRRQIAAIVRASTRASSAAPDP